MSKQLTTIDPARIAKVNGAHKYTVALLEQAHAKAAECGNELIAIKRDLGHGNWEGWCKEHLEFTSRHANSYMQWAKNYQAMAIDERKKYAGLTVDRALAKMKGTEVASTKPNQKSTSDLKPEDTLVPMTKPPAVKKPVVKESPVVDEDEYQTEDQAIWESVMKTVIVWLIENEDAVKEAAHHRAAEMYGTTLGEILMAEYLKEISPDAFALVKSGALDMPLSLLIAALDGEEEAGPLLKWYLLTKGLDIETGMAVTSPLAESD